MDSKAELSGLIAEQERQALGYHGGDLSNERSTALKYYNGEPLGNEVEGRSQVVSSDVFDVIEGMLPPVVKMFAATNNAVDFEPVGQEDERAAKQATAACNYVFYKQNNGVLILYSWFKDALLQKNGIVKWYLEEKSEVVEESYDGLTQMEFERLVAQDNVEVVEHSEYDDPAHMPMMPQMPMQGQMPMQQMQQMTPMLHDVKLKVTRENKKVCIDPVPPEEFIVSAGHNSIDLENCPFCAHRSEKTISDLKQMGFSDKELEDISSDSEGQFNEEKLARDVFQEQRVINDSSDPSMRKIWVSEGYIRADQDGDGIAELIRFIKAGNKVLEHYTAESIDFAALTPIPMTHRFIGKGMADVTMDFQTINTTLWRQGLDNLYLTNNPRHAVIEGQANLDDLLTSRPGGIVRMRAPGAVTPLETPFVAQHIFPMLEYNESRKENRTGVTRYNQGTDADSLNKTAHGVQMIQNASMQRVELIARLFAETGVKRLFRGIKRTLHKSGLRKLSLRLNGAYVDVDPREWSTEWDMTVNVGLGTGNKDQQLGHLQNIAKLQLLFMQAGKPYMVSDENLYQMAAKTTENSGFQHVEAFFTPPQSVPPEAKKPQPNPEMMKLQVESQMDQAKLQSSEKQKMMDLQVTQSTEEKKIAIEKYIAELEVESKERIALAQIHANKELEQIRINAEAQFKVFDANNQADITQAQLSQNERIKSAELQSKSISEDKKIEASSKPAAVMQFSAEKEMGKVAESLKAIAETKTKDAEIASKALTTAVGELSGVSKSMEKMAQAMMHQKPAKSVRKGMFNGKPFEIRDE